MFVVMDRRGSPRVPSIIKHESSHLPQQSFPLRSPVVSPEYHTEGVDQGPKRGVHLLLCPLRRPLV